MLEILQYGFMQRALAAGLIVGTIAPLIGLFLVTRRYSLIADTLSHLALAGVAAGVFLGIPPILAALGVTILGTAGLEGLRRKAAGGGEGFLALFLYGGLAAAAILIGLNRGRGLNVQSLLFGSITTVSATDLVTIALLGLLVIVTIILSFRRLFHLSLDADLAEASGIRTGALNSLLLLLTAFTVGLSIQVVGVLLIGALLVIPVLSALQLARSFRQAAFLSLVCSLLSVLIGLFASAFLNLPSGGSIVLAALGVFVVCLGLRIVRA